MRDWFEWYVMGTHLENQNEIIANQAEMLNKPEQAFDRRFPGVGSTLSMALGIALIIVDLFIAIMDLSVICIIVFLAGLGLVLLGVFLRARLNKQKQEFVKAFHKKQEQTMKQEMRAAAMEREKLKAELREELLKEKLISEKYEGQ